MKRVLLMALAVTASLSTVACGKKKASQQEMIRACMWDPSGQCQRQAAAYAAAPGVLPIAAQLGQNPQLLNGVVNGTVPVVLPPGTPVAGAPAVPGTGGGVGIKTASTDAAIRAQQQKVAAAIKADSLNPNSIHYDPPQADRGPASIAPQSASDVPSFPQLPANVASDGEATR